jgi:hypothetical protein
MRLGGSQSKGSAWERQLGSALSLWITGGVRKDLFCRTVLSGGQHTISEGKLGIPGDLMANHPLAFEFLALFSIEAKHYRSIELDKFIWDEKGSSFLAKVYAKANSQCVKLNLTPLVVAKQNHYPAVAIMSYQTGMAAYRVGDTGFRFHILHNHSVVLVLLDNFIKHVPPQQFIEAARRRSLRHG